MNGPAFLTGWVAGLALASAGLYVVVDAIGVTGDSSGSDSVAWLEVILGVLLLLVAARSWRKRPTPGAETEMPEWMADIESIAPGKALGLGALLSLNPKNLVLGFGAAAGIAHLGISKVDAIVSLAVFVLIGSLTVGALVAYSLAGGARATAALVELKRWLGIHNAAVMTVLFLVFGAVIVAKGLGLLSD